MRALSTGDARIMIGLGGNFVRATLDTDVTEPALMSARLTVQISTKLNRSHLMCGDTAIILPALARTDIDLQDHGSQFVTVEDSMSIVHTSTGSLSPPSSELRSEVSIICDLALALLGADHPVAWARLCGNNDLVRDHVAAVIPGFGPIGCSCRITG